MLKENRETTITEIMNWVRMVGATGPSTPVFYLRFDTEISLSSLLERALSAKIERNPAQTPENTGGAERALRSFKEILSVLK